MIETFTLPIGRNFVSLLFLVVPVIEAAEEIKGDEFWDYDQQVDLEAFSTKDFYTTLAKQTSDVTAALARQKDQVN